jgi:hypothetical protein
VFYGKRFLSPKITPNFPFPAGISFTENPVITSKNLAVNAWFYTSGNDAVV